jgi:hypothetical protein
VPGAVEDSVMLLRTYVFEVWRFQFPYGWEYLGFFPCAPNEAGMAWSVLGIPKCYGHCGDADNSNGTVNVADANYIINFVY